ncbi:MAG: M28 family peptidase [Acholeplasmataceae bacterium]|nr:M28 family peptidase [Acholeplasmataceae bacterium]
MDKDFLKGMQEEVFINTQKIIDDFGPRLAGTDADLKAADRLYDMMSETFDEAHQESFYVHQHAFLGWIRILVSSYLIAIILMWFKLYAVSFSILLIGLFILIIQFFLYLPLLDKLYPKKEAKNVYGIIEPKHEVKKQVIISGHHDSARIFNFFIHQPKLYNARTTGSIVIVILALISSLLLMIFNNQNWLYLGVSISLSILFLWVAQMWFFASKKGTPGAGDNLVAVCNAMAIGKYFKEHPLEHTRLIIASFDAEEEGLRGARDFAKKHFHELKKTPTILLNQDCLYDEAELFLLTSDLNDFVDLDQHLAQEVSETAKHLGIYLPLKPLAFLTGGTDAAELQKIGIPSLSIIGMPWTNSNRNLSYHTPGDILEKVSPEVVIDVLNIFMTYIHQKDQDMMNLEDESDHERD